MKYLTVALILLFSISCDQVTKSIAREELKFSPPIVLVGGLARLDYAENLGAFLGIGSDMPQPVRFGVSVLLFVALLVGLILLLFNLQKLGWVSISAYSLVISGGVGNSIDRLFFNGRVTDFMVVGTEWLHTGIFNVADLCVTTGALLILFGGIKDRFDAKNVAVQTKTSMQEES